jgi:hypothetical protein
VTSGKAAVHSADIDDIRRRANTYKQTIIARNARISGRRIEN